VNSRDAAQLKAIAGSLNFIVSTVNVTLDWVIIDHRKGNHSGNVRAKGNISHTALGCCPAGRSIGAQRD
jgi:hypothetical protein